MIPGSAVLRVLGTACLLALALPAAAQKWVDEKGKVYYGAPPPGVKVKAAEIKGGGASAPALQGTSPRSVVGKEPLNPGSKFARAGTESKDPAPQK